ncbi:mitogen-activated protein kinase kinase kinase [Ranunculus cassubicifolius]
MADDPRLATSEAVYVQNSGIHHNASSPRLRPVMYTNTEAGVAGVGFGNPSMGWYGGHGVPVSAGGVMENANYMYGGVVSENPNFVGRVGENPNFNYRVGYGRGIVENPGLVQQIGGGSGENSGFFNRGGGGSGIGGSPSCDNRGNTSDQASDEGVDDLSSVKKVKFLCSFGGKILPRPSDGVLRYVGGQTRIISVRSDISFQELVHKMIDVYGKPVIIKYQLPDGELDALVSVSCPEDLENMMDEYGKLAESSSNGSAKLRVFLFCASELDPSGLLQFGDLLDSGQRYMDAVNGIPDALGGGIARKVSIGSETSTQNSDGTLGASEVVDSSSYGQGDGGGLSSPYIVSPRVGTISAHDTPTSVMYATSNPMGYTPLMHAGPSEVTNTLPQTLSSLQPESEFKRPMPAMMHPQTSLGYDFHKPLGMDFQQATTYMQTYADPRQQFPSQVGYMNPQGIGIAGPIYRYAATPTQLRDGTFGIPNQQFMPAVPMSAAPLNNHIGINTNVIQQVVQPPNTRGDPYHGENASRARVQFPGEQNYSAYQPQSPSYQPTSPFQVGGGGGLVSSTQHFVPSDGRAIHHPGILPEKPQDLKDCFMCQKALPHAHSDTVVQDLRHCISATVSDSNLGFHSARVENNSGALPLNNEYQDPRSQVSGISQVDLASELGRPGFFQDVEVQTNKDRILQKLVTPDNLGVLSQGVTEKVDDLKSPYGIILHDSPHSHQESVLQQSPMLDQIKQEPLVSLPVVSNFPPVNLLPVQTSKPVILGSPTNYSSNNSSLVADDDTSVSGTSYDNARQIDGIVERTYMNPQYPQLNTGSQYMTSEQQLHGLSPLSALNPEYVTYDTRPVMQRNVPNDAFLNSPVPLSGDTVSANSGALQGNWNQPPPNSLFSNQDPWTLLHDPLFIPSKSNETADEEAFTRTDKFSPQPSEHLNKDLNSSNKDIKQELKATAEEVLNNSPRHLNKDSSSEHNQSNKDENIRQELKSVAEGVAAMVLQSSLPGDSSDDIDESSSEIGHERVLDTGVEASTAKIEDVKNKLPDKENSGLPLSEGIGHLQIIKNCDLEELRELGSGTFGTVYHGKWRGTDVAIKRINNRCFAGKPSERSRMIDDFWNEAIKLADLHHPNVVAFYGVVLDGPGDSVATVTEYMVNGSLRQALVRTLNRRKRLLIAMDVAFGMEYLHGKNIVHFDLKSDNLLVNLKDPHRPICKVGDLGLSKVKCHTLISGGVRGTLPWMAPELLNGSSSLVSEKVDVFSFGIVMWELLTGEEPYADLHYGIIIGGIVSNTLRPEIPASCDPEWRSLMERCWAPEPLGRPSFTEIANELRSMAANLPAKGQSPKE